MKQGKEYGAHRTSKEAVKTLGLPLLFDSNCPMEQQTILSFSENFTTEQ
jgi:hypothetical protein